MQQNELQKIMFLDIETVPLTSDFSELPRELIHLWEDKFAIIQKRMPEKYNEQTTALEAFNTSAGIYSEFGKIVCISVGFIYFQGNEMNFRTKSFSGNDEKLL